MLHGFSLTGAALAPLAERLAGFETLVPDLPGHGGTTGFTADLGGAAAMLDMLLEDGPALLVGWSLGALIAWRRLRHPMVAGVVSLDMSPRPAPDWAFGMSGPAPEGLASPEAWRKGAPALAQGLFAQGGGRASTGLIRQIANRDLAAMRGFWASLIAEDARDAIAASPKPLLAIHGAQSRVYPAGTAAWIAATAPAARAHLLDGAGHAPHLEAPEVTADLIACFAREVLPR